MIYIYPPGTDMDDVPHILAGPGGAKPGAVCNGRSDPNPDCYKHRLTPVEEEPT